MTFFRVNRLWRDEHERNHSEFKDFPSFDGAREFANNSTPRGGDIWIEQREHARRPILTDRKDRASEPDPMTPEHLAQLRSQIRSLKAKTALPKEAA